MKKFALLALLTTLPAAAQTLEASSGKYTLADCFHTKDNVRCDVMYTPSRNYSSVVSRDAYKVVTVDGASLTAAQLSVAGGEFTDRAYTGNVTFYKDVPVRISLLIAVPASTTRFSALGIEGKAIANINVRGSAPTSGLAATMGGYDAVLTNCTTSASKVMTCSATLTPRR